MADEQGAQPAAPGAQPTGQDATQPKLVLLNQYIRDLSFENPRAPASLADGEGRPQVEVQVQIETRRDDTLGRFEVALKVNATGKRQGGIGFVVELDYRGLFEIGGFQQNVLPQVLLVECPRLLFPFARRIVADAVRDGGFPPLFLDPIDFLTLYRQRLQQELAAQQAKGGEQPAQGIA